MTHKILHILDHSIPLHSGYSFRTLAILREQRRLGWETLQLTSSKHHGAGADEEEVDGFHFYRTRAAGGGWRQRAPTIKEAGQLAEYEQMQEHRRRRHLRKARRPGAQRSRPRKYVREQGGQDYEQKRIRRLAEALAAKRQRNADEISQRRPKDDGIAPPADERQQNRRDRQRRNHDAGDA